jgi:hypothetical protein
MRRLYALLLVLLVVATVFIYPRLVSTAAQSRQRTNRQRQPAQRKPRIDYSKFSHRTEKHRLNCDRCHTIPTSNWPAARAADPFPDVTDFPDHDSCVSCHRQQFFVGARPVICTVCHTVVSPRDGSRFVFRNPGEEATRGTRKPKSDSQFAINFPHDKHQDVMAHLRRGADAEGSGFRFVRAAHQTPAPKPKKVDSCTICHATHDPQGASDVEEMTGRPKDVDVKLWPKKGTFKTTPTSHASCFNCHWQEGGAKPLSTDCAACHKITPPGAAPIIARERTDADKTAASKFTDGDIRAKWLRRESVRFRHEIERHEEIGCTSCHIQITSINTLDLKTFEVDLLTCGGTGSSCHIKPKPKAILNVEVDKKRADAAFQCIKCHLNYGNDAIPRSHSDPVPVPTPKP